MVNWVKISKFYWFYWFSQVLLVSQIMFFLPDLVCFILVVVLLLYIMSCRMHASKNMKQPTFCLYCWLPILKRICLNCKIDLFKLQSVIVLLLHIHDACWWEYGRADVLLVLLIYSYIATYLLKVQSVFVSCMLARIWNSPTYCLHCSLASADCKAYLSQLLYIFG